MYVVYAVMSGRWGFALFREGDIQAFFEGREQYSCFLVALKGISELTTLFVLSHDNTIVAIGLPLKVLFPSPLSHASLESSLAALSTCPLHTRHAQARDDKEPRGHRTRAWSTTTPKCGWLGRGPHNTRREELSSRASISCASARASVGLDRGGPWKCSWAETVGSRAGILGAFLCRSAIGAAAR